THNGAGGGWRRPRAADVPSPMAFFHPDCTVGSGGRSIARALGSAASWRSSMAPLVGSSRVAGPYHRSGIAPCPEGSRANLPLAAQEFEGGVRRDQPPPPPSACIVGASAG